MGKTNTMLTRCPLCGVDLRGRLAQVSHFSKHERTGELTDHDWDPDGHSWRTREGYLVSYGVKPRAYETPEQTVTRWRNAQEEKVRRIERGREHARHVQEWKEPRQ